LPSKGCRCYSQQATRLDVPSLLCKQIASTGFFMAWDEERGEKPSRRAQEPISAAHVPPGISGGVIVAPEPLLLSPSPKPDGGGSSTNPKFAANL